MGARRAGLRQGIGGHRGFAMAGRRQWRGTGGAEIAIALECEPTLFPRVRTGPGGP